MSGQRLRVPGTHVVVREDQVRAAPLHGEVGAEFFEGDDRTFDVPPGSPGPDRRFPRRFAGPRGLPEQWIEAIAFACPVGVSTALGKQPEHADQVKVALVAEGPACAVFCGVNVEIQVGRDRSVSPRDGILGRHGIGESSCLQERDGGRDLIDDLGHGDEIIRRNNAEGLHVGAEQFNLGFGQLTPVHTGGRGAFQKRVVDIRHVLGVVHAKTRVNPDPLQGVEGQVGVGVADVRRIVGRDPADVETGGIERPCQHEAVGFGVVEPRCTRFTGDRDNVGSFPCTHSTSLASLRRSVRRGQAARAG